MRQLGIIRKIDDLGRVVIPKELRRNMGVREGDAIEMYLTDMGLILTPYQNDFASKLRGMAEHLDTLGFTEKHWEIAKDLKKIAKKLEMLDK